MRQFEFTSALSLNDALISSFILLFLNLVSLLIFSFYQPGERYWYFRLLFPITGAVIFIWLHQLIWTLLLTLNWVAPPFTEGVTLLRFVFVFFVLLVTSLFAWFFYRLKSQRRQLNRKRESEQLLKESELILIRRQMQPHFLFNSLNSISSLVKSSPDDAREMIGKLSDLLRITLKGQQKTMVTLEEELEYIKLYIDMEKLRFGTNLRITLDVDPQSTKSNVPGMIMQPLLENALKYSTKNNLEQVSVSIWIRQNQAMLEIEIQNNFDEGEIQMLKGSGFGIDAVKRRLFLLYGRNDLIRIRKEEGNFIVKILIPQYGKND